VGKHEEFVLQALKYSATVLPDGEMHHQILKIPWNLKRRGDKKEAWNQTKIWWNFIALAVVLIRENAPTGASINFHGRREPVRALQHGIFLTGKCSVQFTYLK